MAIGKVALGTKRHGVGSWPGEEVLYELSLVPVQLTYSEPQPPGRRKDGTTMDVPCSVPALSSLPGASAAQGEVE